MMDVTSSPPNTTDYIYVYDEDTSPCSEGNGFSKFRSLFLPIFYCLVFVSCLMGNTLVLWVLITRKKITTMTDMCLLNLAISDLLFVLPLPFQAHYASDNWIFGNAVCKIMAGIYYMGFYSSIFFITLMSIDRYIAIVHVVNARKIRTATWGVLISLVLWLVAGFASVPNMVFSKEVVIEQSVECVPDYPPGQETWRIFTHFGINLLGLVFPLGILIYCYSRILINLQCVRVKNRNKIKAIRMIFIIVICFFIFWTPFNIVLFLDSLQIMHIINECKTSHNLALALQLTEAISFIHCCLNPVIYAFAGEIFKAHIKKLFQSWIHVIQNTSGADSSSLFNSWHTQIGSICGHSHSSPEAAWNHHPSPEQHHYPHLTMKEWNAIMMGLLVVCYCLITVGHSCAPVPRIVPTAKASDMLGDTEHPATTEEVRNWPWSR